MKVSLVLSDDLKTWQRINVAAFLVSGIVGAHRELIGQPYVDHLGNTYNALLIEPIAILVADRQTLCEIHMRAVNQRLRVSLFVEGMFDTMDDESNRRAMKQASLSQGTIVGVGLNGDKKTVDKITKDARLHP